MQSELSGSLNAHRQAPATAQGDPSIRGMQRLMQAIVLQALQDLKTMSRKPYIELDRAHAIAFFERRGEWGQMFDTICEYAGYDPEAMQCSYRRFMAAQEIDLIEYHRQRMKPKRGRGRPRKERPEPPADLPRVEYAAPPPPRLVLITITDAAHA